MPLISCQRCGYDYAGSDISSPCPICNPNVEEIARLCAALDEANLMILAKKTHIEELYRERDETRAELEKAKARIAELEEENASLESALICEYG